MALRVSVDGLRSTLANNVVIYRDDVPVAVAYAIDEENVMFADGVRDDDFKAILAKIGVHADKLPIKGPTIKGKLNK